MAKIMVVEDDQSLREIYSIRLTAEGYDVVSAGDGEEALAMAVREKPDLIVSDVMMPKISGFDMLDILRSTPETKNVKVIMMTALSSEDQRKRGENLGADRYLVKSQVGIEDVITAVHDVLVGDGGVSLVPPIVDSSAIAPNTPSEAPAPQSEAPVAPAVVPEAPVVAPAPEAPVVAPEPAAPAPAVETPAPAEVPAAPTPAPVVPPAEPVVPAEAPVAPAVVPEAPVVAPAPEAPVVAPEPAAPAPAVETLAPAEVPAAPLTQETPTNATEIPTGPVAPAQ